MKLKLSINKLPLNGYLNIDPCPVIPDEYKPVFDIVHADYSCVNELVYDAECEEIIVDNVIDYIKIEHLYTFLNILITKLRHDGTITIVGLDIEEVIKQYINNQISLYDLNQKIYGKCQHAWHYKNSGTTMHNLVTFFKEKGLKIERKSIHDGIITICARRN